MAPLLEYFEWHIAVPYRSSKKVKMRLNVASDTCQQNTDMVNPCKSTLSQSETYTRWVSTQIWLRSSHFKTSLQKLEGFEDLPQVYRVLASVWLVCLNIFSSGNVVETWWNMVKLCGIGWAQLSSVRTPGGSNFNCCPAWLECLAWWWKCRIESFEPVPQDIPRRSNSWSMLEDNPVSNIRWRQKVCMLLSCSARQIYLYLFVHFVHALGACWTALHWAAAEGRTEICQLLFLPQFHGDVSWMLSRIHWAPNHSSYSIQKIQCKRCTSWERKFDKTPRLQCRADADHQERCSSADRGTGTILSKQRQVCSAASQCKTWTSWTTEDNGTCHLKLLLLLVLLLVLVLVVVVVVGCLWMILACLERIYSSRGLREEGQQDFTHLQSKHRPNPYSSTAKRCKERPKLPANRWAWKPCAMFDWGFINSMRTEKQRAHTHKPPKSQQVSSGALLVPLMDEASLLKYCKSTCLLRFLGQYNNKAFLPIQQKRPAQLPLYIKGSLLLGMCCSATSNNCCIQWGIIPQTREMLNCFLRTVPQSRYQLYQW